MIGVNAQVVGGDGLDGAGTAQAAHQHVADHDRRRFAPIAVVVG